MNSHPMVTDITYPQPEEKCLSEVEKAIKHISKPEDGFLNLGSNFSEAKSSTEKKCFDNVMDMAASSALLEQQPSSFHCSGQKGGQFYIAIDASTVAAIKGGSHYTLISVEGERVKTLSENDLGEENADQNKSSSCGNVDTSKSVCLELPLPAIAAQLTAASDFSHSVKQEIDEAAKNSDNTFKSEGAEVRDAENKATSVFDKHSQYSTTTLTTLVPSSVTNESNPERAKEYTFPNGTVVRGADCSTFQEECKDMEYATLTPRISNIKQEPELQKCVNFSTPIGTYGTPVGNQNLHSKMMYTSGGIPSGLRRPYPYHAGKSPHIRSFQLRTPWTPYNPQTSALPSTQMTSPVPIAATPSSVSGSASNASVITLNSSGEELKQDSSPEFPRVPFNTPDSSEGDMSSVRRVTLTTPDRHQVAAHCVRYVDRMRYYTPFSDREDHNQKERERRSRIKESCQKLRALVPGLNEKTDKATVFEHAAAYVDFLKMRLGTKYDEEYLDLENNFSY